MKRNKKVLGRSSPNQVKVIISGRGKQARVVKIKTFNRQKNLQLKNCHRLVVNKTETKWISTRRLTYQKVRNSCQAIRTSIIIVAKSRKVKLSNNNRVNQRRVPKKVEESVSQNKEDLKVVENEVKNKQAVKDKQQLQQKQERQQSSSSSEDESSSSDDDSDESDPENEKDIKVSQSQKQKSQNNNSTQIIETNNVSDDVQNKTTQQEEFSPAKKIEQVQLKDESNQAQKADKKQEESESESDSESESSEDSDTSDDEETNYKNQNKSQVNETQKQQQQQQHGNNNQTEKAAKQVQDENISGKKEVSISDKVPSNSKIITTWQQQLNGKGCETGTR
eukprot:TRINITY_DN30231_c0_g1_i1.p1 TRINITY_DN30231_c0_g1~~TRINITY_DN30231_c0_g1_i1.p1  ORF type:complete len:336 (-),score=41.46 TRINITY_DN30231_c0_g1_i1:27-1034(-)